MAYEAEDGVYFDTQAFGEPPNLSDGCKVCLDAGPQYGKLAPNAATERQEGHNNAWNMQRTNTRNAVVGCRNRRWPKNDQEGRKGLCIMEVGKAGIIICLCMSALQRFHQWARCLLSQLQIEFVVGRFRLHV